MTLLTKTELVNIAEFTGLPVFWVGASNTPPMGKNLRPHP